MATRLADAAEPGRILVGPETAAQLDATYRVQDLGGRAMKNIADQVKVHAVLGKS